MAGGEHSPLRSFILNLTMIFLEHSTTGHDARCRVSYFEACTALLTSPPSGL